MNTLIDSAVRPGQTADRSLEPIPANQMRSIPNGWRKLHRVAVTLDVDHLPDYASDFFRDCFGASACEEEAVSDTARAAIRGLKRPVGPKLSVTIISRTMRHLRLGRSQTTRTSRQRGKRRFAIGTVDLAEDAPGASKWAGSTGPPTELRYTALPAADPYARWQVDERQKVRPHHPRRATAHSTGDGAPPRLSTTNPTDRWSFGSCSTEFCFDNTEEHRTKATGDPPWVELRERRRPKVTDVSTRQREGPLGADWVKSAYLITNEDGEVTRRPVRIKMSSVVRRTTSPDETENGNEGLAKRRYQVVARRLKKGAVVSAGTGQTLKKRTGSARDGPPLKEASP
jgi:hypothetical protein